MAQRRASCQSWSPPPRSRKCRSPPLRASSASRSSPPLRSPPHRPRASHIPVGGELLQWEAQSGRREGNCAAQGRRLSRPPGSKCRAPQRVPRETSAWTRWQLSTPAHRVAYGIGPLERCPLSCCNTTMPEQGIRSSPQRAPAPPPSPLRRALSRERYPRGLQSTPDLGSTGDDPPGQ